MAQAAGESSRNGNANKAKSNELTASSMSQLAGSKLRKKMSGSFQEHVSAPTSDFAVKQLEKMGWTAGTGLGKKRDGVVSHIKVKKREENSGLGIEKHKVEMQRASDDWWKSSLGDTLAKLGSKKGKKKKKEAKKEFTDEELFEATGGARFGMRAGKSRNLAKWRRTESEISSDAARPVESQHAKISSSSSSSSSNSETETSGKDYTGHLKQKKKRKRDEARSIDVVDVDHVTKKKKPKKDKKQKKKKKETG
mmetsp:Transcript_5382/g.11058  ORF Transcript_5382/g.11058 Transcript_5382/m.11058 type:complete len:252 (+) Transcript_5382:14-769(+)|eukprot:CAMPEP_0168782166 /NCGR_PEP_ID=MMETSP0725-20121227/9021_1 /TAXON_ID=265536 /ORGANISM="Amphiprora sp., Strain CCMP467" /LENGTH=251 /DNA_ID=CAMNT_0008832085 /DNA_START=19 /DNA_END=774 /DNA_ORIENTATION=-